MGPGCTASAAEGEDPEDVAPFALDPEFDYDATPVGNTQRFSVARALVEGEYYDRLLHEATSPARDYDRLRRERPERVQKEEQESAEQESTEQESTEQEALPTLT